MTILPVTRRQRLLLWRHDRPSVLELDPRRLPGAARRPAAQRIDGHPQLVTGLDARAVPAIAQKQAGRAAFQEPDRAGPVPTLHFEVDVNVRRRVAELGDGPNELNRMLLIEHRKRVVPTYGASRCEQCSRREQRGYSWLAVQVGPPRAYCK